MPSSEIEKFWSCVDKSGGPAACWPWKGAKRNAKGYGGFYADGRTQVAHRWLLGHLRGTPLEWPDEVGCHRCDNPPCCNPAHLYIGDHHQNTIDAMERSGHPAAAEAARTHCGDGHEFTEENTHYFGPGNRRRYCRTCKRNKSRISMQKQRDKKRQQAA